MMHTKAEISYKTIFFTLFLVIALWFLIQIWEIILWVFIAFIFMSALKPSTEYLERMRFSRVVAVLLQYIGVLLVFGFIGSFLVPPIVVQSIHLAESLPSYVQSVFPFLTIDAQTLSQQLTPVGENIFRVTIGFFSNIISLFTIFVISFYLLLERKYLEPQLSAFMGEEGAHKLVRIVAKIEHRLGAWVRGQLFLMLIIGVTSFVGLLFLGIPFALPLALLAGILEFVPIIGPILSAVPAILVALTLSPFLALLTGILYFLIQQAEANFIVPAVMKRTVGMPPLVTIVALMVGGKLAGIIGALLSVPVLVAVATAVTEYVNLRAVTGQSSAEGS